MLSMCELELKHIEYCQHVMDAVFGKVYDVEHTKSDKFYYISVLMPNGIRCMAAFRGAYELEDALTKLCTKMLQLNIEDASNEFDKRNPK